MTPQDLLQHSDSGELWPEGGGAVFADVPSAYRSALAVRALRIARGETPRGYKIGFTNRSIWPRYNVYRWAMVAGPPDTVDLLVAWARQGPRSAVVGMGSPAAASRQERIRR